jgi:hypothetical protein
LLLSADPVGYTSIGTIPPGTVDAASVSDVTAGLLVMLSQGPQVMLLLALFVLFLLVLLVMLLIDLLLIMLLV